MRGLCFLAPLVCVGCTDQPAPPADPPVEPKVQADRPAPPGDRPLGPKIHSEAIPSAEGKDRPRQLVVRGTLGGPGQLELNPNILILDAEGRIQGGTKMYRPPIPVRIKPADAPDPGAKGRQVY